MKNLAFKYASGSIHYSAIVVSGDGLVLLLLSAKYYTMQWVEDKRTCDSSPGWLTHRTPDVLHN